ncbi:hypothetical protein Tco_1188166 [Tanacetum coccineum]
MSGWITDSGANQHMTDSTKNMFNVVDISSLMLTVGHPNGTLAKFSVIGLNLGKLMGAGSKTGGLYMFDVDKIAEWVCKEESLTLLNVSRNLMLPSSVLTGASPYFLVYGKDPSLSHIREKNYWFQREGLNGLDYEETCSPVVKMASYGVLACKPVATPLQRNVVLSHVETDKDKFLPILVFWKSKKQATISRSLSEAKYRCLASTTCELILVVKVLKGLEVDSLLRVDLYCDSSSANPVFYEKN